MRSTIHLPVIALLCAAAPGALRAQTVSGFGEVSGKVSDTQNVGIPDTTVAVFNERLSVQRTMTTTDDGVFDAVALIPAKGYKLEVTRKNFEKWESGEFEVVLGHPVNFNITLLMEKEAAPAGTPPAVPGLNPKVYDVSETLDQLELESLPSRTRRAGQLAPLTPGVTADADTGAPIFVGVRSTPAMTIDGSSVSNTFHLQMPLAEQLPQEAIQAMQTISSGVSPEFGNTMAGAIDVVTRSGSDALHGSLYDFFNNHGWNAGNRYGAGFRPTGRQHQGGFSVGDHARPDNAFWFVNAEIVDDTTEGINRITNPLITNPAGTAIPAANCAVSITVTAAQCASAIKFIQSQMNVVVPRTLYSLSGVAKVDYHLGQSNTVNLEGDARHFNGRDWAFPGQIAPNGGMLGGNGNLGEEERHAKAGLLSELGTRALNDFRFTYFHDRISDYGDSKLLPATGPVVINVAGTSIGGNPVVPMVLSEQRWQYADHLTLPIYSTTFKAGFAYTRTTDALNQLFNRSGVWDYPSLTAFASDFSGNTAGRKSYTSFQQTLGTLASNITTPEYNLYIQGNWRALNRLTVTYGFTWDKNRFSAPLKSNATYYQTASISSPNKDFAPRVAAAYSLNDKTIVRVNVGEYFQPFLGDLITALNTQNGAIKNTIWLNPTQTGAPVFPRGLVTSNNYPTGSQSVFFALSKWRNPHTLEGTASIERRLSKDTTATVGVIYSRGVGLWTISDQNLNPSTTLKTYLIDDAKGNQVGTFMSLMYDSTATVSGKNNGSWAHAYQIANAGNSKYEAAFAQLRKQMSHGLSAQASYTFSHSVDDVSGPSLLGPIPLTTYNGDYRADQGPSSFDQRHRVTASWVWQPSVSGQSSAVMRGVVNGWQVSGTLMAGSSMHQTPIVIVNGQQFSSITMLYTNSMDGSGGWNRVPFEPVNSLSTGPRYELDARISRTFSFGERFKLTVLGEAFNVLNKQFNTGVNTIAFTSTAGLPPGLKNGPISGTLTPVPEVGVPNAANSFPYGTNSRRAQVAFRFVF
jgi:hypothetical protein